MVITGCVSTQAWAAHWQSFAQPVFHAPLGNTSPLEGEISTILEDQSGFIWLVAANGLWRWDSKNLVKAQFDAPADATAFIQVNTGFTDASGLLWVGTNNGLYRLIPGSVKFTPVAPELLNSLSIQAGVATRLQGNDVLLLATDREIYQFNSHSLALSKINAPDSQRIHALHIDTTRTLWVGIENGLYTSSPADQTYSDLLPVPLISKDVRVSAITSSADNSLIVGTAADGLFIKPPAGNFARIALSQSTPPWVFSLAEIRANVLLIGTFGDGLTELNLITNERRHFTQNRLLPAGLTDNNIWSLFSDSRGLVWIGSGSTLNVYDGRNTAIAHLFGESNQARGLRHRKVNAVQALDDKLIVGSGGNGLEVLTADEGVIDSWWQKSADPVETLFVDSTGKLYASANFATVSLTPGQSQVTPLIVPGRNISAFTTALAQSPQALWIGGTDGLWQMPTAAPEDSAQLFSPAIAEQRVASLLAQRNTLWIGTWQGLMKGQLQNGLLRPETITLVEHPRLKQQFIADLYEDSLGQLWVATSGAGLFVLTPDQRWQAITTAVGLPGDNVAAIAGESHGQVWVGTSRGIAAVDINHKILRVVAAGPTAVNSPYSRGAATITPNGELAFGGVNGLTIITPERLAENVPPFTLTFTRFEVVDADNHKIHPAAGQPMLHISPLPKRISFEFIALDYMDPEHVQYRYRLAGSDENWTILDADHRIVTLTSLTPGEYTLELQYSEDGRTWSQAPLTQKFTVQPAWFQTNLASLAGLLLLAIAIYLLHQLGLRHYRYRQAVLEHKIAARTAELVTANEKLSEQAVALKTASLTDALTGLHNRRFLTQNIQRDISRVQRYYKDCQQHNRQPDYRNDILFFVIDLDHFKRINDTYGHQAGDAVLVETQQRLSTIFRDTDYLIRWGGEEFLAVVQDTSRDEACVLAERIVSTVNAGAFTINDTTQLPVTCSVGFAAYPLHQQQYNYFDWQSTIGIADAALYGAKRRGRDSWMGVTTIKTNAAEETLALIKQQPNRVFDHAAVLVRQQILV